MAAGGTPANVDLGPGRLYYAPLGTAEPASCSAALPSAWIPVGYTEDGTEVQTDITSEGIEVAEELDPVLFEQTRRTTKLTISMAEATVSRLALALGAGAARANDSAAFEFPDAGSVVPVMFVWDSDEAPSATNRRWIFRRCTPSGTVSTARRKAPQKALIPVTFDCARPDGTTRSVRVFPNASGQI
jgi:hypothetical protein